MGINHRKTLVKFFYLIVVFVLICRTCILQEPKRVFSDLAFSAFSLLLRLLSKPLFHRFKSRAGPFYIHLPQKTEYIFGALKI